MAFEIEKGIPLAKVASPSSPRASKYPWADMEVGDSFLVPGTSVSRLSPSVCSASRRVGFKFKTRTVEGGVRVWRVE